MFLKHAFRYNIISLKKCLYFRNFSNNNSWKVLFFGTDLFSLESLKKIHNEYNNSTISKLEIVTNIANKRNEVYKYAHENNIVVHPWPVTISDESFHIGIVVSFGYLIPKHLILKFPLGMINVHASLLPRWRGASPIVHSLLNGDTHTGVSIMKIQPHHFDVGEIIHQKRIEIDDDTLQPELHKQLAVLGSEALIECIRNLPGCLNNAFPQEAENVTYAPKIERSIAKINWEERTATEIYNLSRALYDIYPLETQFKNHFVKLKRLYVDINDIDNSKNCTNVDSKPGHFKFIKEKNVISVFCKNNTSIYFDSIHVKGKNNMSALDFRNGYMKNVPTNELYFTSI